MAIGNNESPHAGSVTVINDESGARSVRAVVQHNINPHCVEQ
jgi:hypothetical protein